MHEGEKIISPISDKASFHDTKNGDAEAPYVLGDDNVRDNEVEIITELKFNGTQCELAAGSTTNIVAFGTIVEDESANITIHGTKLGEDCIRVSVDGGIQYDATLPCPVKDELETVRQAMKKIIEDEELSFPRKWALKNRKQYTQEELDEVRIEVSDYLGTIM